MIAVGSKVMFAMGAQGIVPVGTKGAERIIQGVVTGMVDSSPPAAMVDAGELEAYYVSLSNLSLSGADGNSGERG